MNSKGDDMIIEEDDKKDGNSYLDIAKDMTNESEIIYSEVAKNLTLLVEIKTHLRDLLILDKEILEYEEDIAELRNRKNGIEPNNIQCGE